MFQLQGLPSCHAPQRPAPCLFKQFQISMARVSPQMGIPIQAVFVANTSRSRDTKYVCVCVCESVGI